MFHGLTDLVERLDAAVTLRGPDAITAQIKDVLCNMLSGSELKLPDTYWRTREDGYARRLLHQNLDLGYTAVVMTWAPGQCTPLHDHGGLWCVEGVVDGTMQVTQYDLVDQSNGSYAFAERGKIQAGLGSAGSLIPPVDYHVLGNALAERPSLTLHVYGGDLTRCHVFLPRPDGRYERHDRTLSYHE